MKHEGEPKALSPPLPAKEQYEADKQPDNRLDLVLPTKGDLAVFNEPRGESPFLLFVELL